MTDFNDVVPVLETSGETETIKVDPPNDTRPPRPRKPSKPRLEKLDSSGFMTLGKKIVVDNFNSHRKPERSEPLDVEHIQVIWFTKALSIWKMIVMSPLARGILWEITYNSIRDEIYLDVYGKINNVKIGVGGEPV